MAGKKKSTYSIFFRSYTKYILVLLVFLLWVTFFDKNSILNGKKLSSEIHQLEEEYSTFANEKKYYQEQLKDLRENPEKFAREEYFMMKDNELVFILE